MTSFCIMAFQKASLFCQNITHKYQGWMLITANTHASVILVILHDHMLKNKQSHRPSLYSMTSLVVLFAHPIKLNLSTRNTVIKILSKSYCDFNDLCSAIKNYWTTFRVINTLDIPLLITICFVLFYRPLTSKLVRFMACQLREEARLTTVTCVYEEKTFCVSHFPLQHAVSARVRRLQK